MGKFACKLHLIANFGSASDKALKMWQHEMQCWFYVRETLLNDF
jgi:hypothetical protein